MLIVSTCEGIQKAVYEHVGTNVYILYSIQNVSPCEETKKAEIPVQTALKKKPYKNYSSSTWTFSTFIRLGRKRTMSTRQTASDKRFLHLGTNERLDKNR